MPEDHDFTGLRAVYEADQTLHMPALAKPPSMDLPKATQDVRALNKRLIAAGEEPLAEQAAGDGAECRDEHGNLYPMSDGFLRRFEELRVAKRHAEAANSVTGYDERYNPNAAETRAKILESLGVDPDTVDSQSYPAGRAAIHNYQVARALSVAGETQHAHITPPWVWPGFASQLKGIVGKHQVVHAAANPDKLYGMTPDTLEEAASFSEGRGLRPTDAIVIAPDNPTGLTHSSVQEFIDDVVSMLEVCDRHDMKLFLDMFYFYLSNGEMGDNEVVGKLIKACPPELAHRLSILIGTTKGTGSDQRWAGIIMPKGNENPKARAAWMQTMKGSRSSVNYYGTRLAGHIAEAAFTTTGGFRAAIAPRFEALDVNRREVVAVNREFGLACVDEDLVGSFYSGAVLVRDGESIILDANGRPSTNPLDTIDVLKQAGIGIAPPDIFRSHQEGSLSGVFVRQDNAQPHGIAQKWHAAFDKIVNGGVRSRIE